MAGKPFFERILIGEEWKRNLKVRFNVGNPVSVALFSRVLKKGYLHLSVETATYVFAYVRRHQSVDLSESRISDWKV